MCQGTTGWSGTCSSAPARSMRHSWAWPRAQRREHLDLLDALGIEDGLVVVTKADVVSPDRVDEVVAEVRALVARTSLRGSSIVPASAVAGEGLEAVVAGLV